MKSSKSNPGFGTMPSPSLAGFDSTSLDVYFGFWSPSGR